MAEVRYASKYPRIYVPQLHGCFVQWLGSRIGHEMGNVFEIVIASTGRIGVDFVGFLNVAEKHRILFLGFGRGVFVWMVL